MLEPKKQKYRRTFRGKNRGLSWRGGTVSFGEFGLQARERGFITSRQIEAARRAIRNYAKRGGKLWIRVFPDKPITSKGSEGRMGGGKGPVDHYAAVIRPGAILFEIAGLPEEVVKEAFRLASHKLPLKTTVVRKD